MGSTGDRSSKIAAQLEAIVGGHGLTAWDELEGGMQSRIRSALRPGDSVAWVVAPATEDELAEVMTCAQHHHWRVLPCGAGSKLAWGGLTEDIAFVISTARMHRLIDHAVGDLTVTAEAGIRFADLQATLATANQCLAIAPTYSQHATLGGIVATADTGAIRHRYGGIRDMVIGLAMVRADGQRAKAGGRVVKNVAGYDLMKLLTGSYGTLGLLTELTLRLYPLPEASRTVLLTGTAAAIAQASRTLLASVLTPTAVELLSPSLTSLISGKPEIGLMACFQSIPASVDQQATHLLQIGQTLGLTGTLLSEDEENKGWQRSQNAMESSTNATLDATPDAPTDALTEVFCKFGVLPATTTATLETMHRRIPDARIRLQAGSGLGRLRWQGDDQTVETLLTLRQWCQTQGGFLSILEAPATLKHHLDLWGYTGNALSIMENIKKQFDPAALLSPGRFVAGI